MGIEKTPDDYWGYYHKGLSCLKLKNYDQAIDNFQKSLDYIPTTQKDKIAYIKSAKKEAEDYMKNSPK